jgi:hypothetical protein
MQSRLLVRVATAALLTATAYVGVTAAQQQGAPIAPKPGPEHEILKLDAGTWNGKVELVPAPGVPAINATVVETSMIGCGGTCLITDAKGSDLVPGVPFVGHGVMTWDPAKKVYVGSWADNLMNGLARTETTYDPKTKKHTGWTEGLEEGKLTKNRVVVEYPTPTTRTMTSFATGPDGKEFQQLKISYTKK